MTTTAEQDRDFGAEFLESVVEFVSRKFTPEEVFGESKFEEACKAWAKDHASEHFGPRDLFSRTELEEWAEDNGFVEGES